jgi:hypothetical protein
MACKINASGSQGGARSSLALGWYEAGRWPAFRTYILYRSYRNGSVGFVAVVTVV